MTIQNVLIPYNFRDIDQKALDFVIQTYEHQKDIKITLFHIYIPLPQIDTDSSTVMGRLSSSMHFLSNELKGKEETLQQARQYLLKKGFTEAQVDYQFKPRSKQVADEIIDTAKVGHYNVIILSYQPQRITRVFVQSVHKKVIASLRDVTICIVT